MERASLAREIIHPCLEMTRLGLNQGTAGNVSVRYRGGLLITPSLPVTDSVPILPDEEIALVLEKFKSYGLRIEE
ncbi:MAG TPA: class II aldolase/adducin family protein [Buttiauxella sp.]|nr:class II aldolase/adducin family protein [Buttiauxella sp.]HKM97682.1 class II aldolase/adducin family protein [Buttiauxella sp.]